MISTKLAPQLRSRMSRTSAARSTVRSLSTSGPDVDVENFSRAEWKTYGDISNYKPGKFVIQTFNKISSVGLKEFGDGVYQVKPADAEGAGNPHAILLRSHKLKEDEVPHTVRAIAR
jgi:D-3-phosphoglycerate dehydrogenase